MIDYGYLPKGLWALARAHRVSTMSGHLGAAVVSGYFVGEQHPDIDEQVCRGIEGELERIIRGESVFSPGKQAALQAPAMFEPFPREVSREHLIDGIAEALAGNIGQLRESGHNVIFAATALRGLKGHPDLATPAVVDGIRRLIRGFDNASPGSGYYGREKGRINGREVVLPDDDSPPLTDLTALADTVATALLLHAAERRVGFGGLWHVINHAAALAELARHGYPELARAGLPAFARHHRLYASLPDVAAEQGPETPTEDSPFAPQFWAPDKLRRERAHLTHRIKTLYGFWALADLIEQDATRDRAADRLRYLM